MRRSDRIKIVLRGWRGDAVIAVVTSAILLGYLAANAMLQGTNNVLEAGCAVGVFSCVIIRQSCPQLAALVAAALLAIAGLAGSSAGFPGSLIFVPVFLLAYCLGTSARPWRALLVLLLLGVAVQLGVGQWNPFVVFVIAGPWATGQIIRSRRNLTEQLAVRGRELEAERALFAAEAVRYERAQIARELHDIVAHCVSVMVIQASAGQRLAGTDPRLAMEAFDAIGEAASQAEAEIGRLLELLAVESPRRDADGLRSIADLVARAGAAGLAVSCRLSGSADHLEGEVADIAYRVVQESLTNAFKHAPGSHVEVLIAATPGQVHITVANGLPAGPASGLEGAGSGRGLAGIRERAAACGGEVSAGPVQGGGWRLVATLPVSSGTAHPGHREHQASSWAYDR